MSCEPKCKTVKYFGYDLTDIDKSEPVEVKITGKHIHSADNKIIQFVPSAVIKEQTANMCQGEFVRISLITGKEKWINSTQIAGYCNYKLHKGILTLKLYRSHHCKGKNCPYFFKFENYPYWKLKTRKENKKAAAQVHKRNKKEHKEIQKYKAHSLTSLQSLIQTEIDHLDEEFVITRIVEKGSNSYVAFFVSNNDFDDSERLSNIRTKLTENNEIDISFRHIKRLDGTFASISDFRHRNKN